LDFQFLDFQFLDFQFLDFQFLVKIYFQFEFKYLIVYI
jgi:hypothetical protein